MAYSERSDLTYQRNCEIVRICMALAEEIYSQGGIARMNLIALEVSKKPSPRFWVSEERARAVIKSWLHHDEDSKPYQEYANPDTMHPLNLAMYREIYARYKLLKEKHPSWSTTNIIHRVVNSPAPSFYLTPDSIRIYFYKHRKYEKQKSKRLAKP